MSLSAYLAKNYLNSSNPSNDPSDLSTRPRKRRKKDKPTLQSSSTLTIADDDDLSLRNPAATNDDDENRPIYDQSHHSAEFRKSKKNNWQALSSSTRAPDAGPADDANDHDAADRILARAAAERTAHDAEIEHEDGAAIVGSPSSPGGPKMSSGIRAGLQTAADSERLEREEAGQRHAAKKARASTRDGPPPEEETVYRDATGRRIDVSMKRAEARAAALAAARAARQEKEDAMGEVQRAEQARRKEDLVDARFLPVARAADDEDMNDDLKARLRWDDPMAGYMLQKQAEEVPVRKLGAGTGSPRRGRRRKEYVGAAPPNRYGVRPGWRWDGVDRGNGFEKDWFQARGKQARTKDLEYQWQMDE